MDFFEHQDKARKNTTMLVVYFVIAVACIIASVYIASLLIFYGANAKQQQPGGPPPELVLWDPKLFLYVVIGTLVVVVVIGSLYKTAALAKGASAVAESLGGRLVNPNTTHPDERKLRNVIEKMALAAGSFSPRSADNENSWLMPPRFSTPGIRRGFLGRCKKSGGTSSKVEPAHAGEPIHMFFGNGAGKPFLGALKDMPMEKK